MSETKRCPHCGATLSVDAPGGLCLSCLVKLGAATPINVSIAEEEIASGEPEPAPARRSFGDYELLEEIGHGGMGVVHKARQVSLNRFVALKVMKPGMDSGQVLARFEAERQALALMDHSNIARVIDAGTIPAGRPYFVMELLSGMPITQFCDEQRLSIPERLELFMSVCQAIQHAHQKGIIHRDIKPSNVLVTLQDGKPVPKVIDFGVAKAVGQRLTEETLMTQFGVVIGTLEYMSPEQAGLFPGDIDTRSDIYALGILLYELLTGTTPLNRKTLGQVAFDQLLRLIREQEPPRPSTRLAAQQENRSPASAAASHREPPLARRSSKIPADLDWIVMKALEKERTRRYETAASLAQDVHRFLNQEPVAARPPSTTYGMLKFARKHRVAVAAAAAFILSLVALTLWAMGEQKRAEHNLKTALKAVNQYLTQLADDPRLRYADLDPLRGELLQAAVPFLEELSRQRSDDPELRRQLGTTYQLLARQQTIIGRLLESVTNAGRARDIFQSLANAPKHAALARQELAETCGVLARTLELMGQWRDAEAHHREAIDLNKKLAAEFRAEPLRQCRLSASQFDLARCLWAAGRPGEGREMYGVAANSLRELMAAHPGSNDFKREFVRVVRQGEQRLIKFEGGVSNRTAALSEALQVARELIAAGPPSKDDRALLGAFCLRWLNASTG